MISFVPKTWVKIVFGSNSKSVGIALLDYLSLYLLVLRSHEAFIVSFAFVTQSFATWITFDAPPNSLMDLTTSPKVKTIEGKGVGAHSLVRNTLGVEGHVGALGWD